jgi:hypothetical protein
MKLIGFLKTLATLQEQIEQMAMENVRAPKGSKPEKGEEVLGTVPDELKKFFAVLDARRAKLSSECDVAHDQLLTMKPGAERDALCEKHELEHLQLDLIKDLFWLCLREAFPRSLRQSGKINLRDNWQVTFSPMEDDDGPRIVSLSVIRL